VARAAGLASRAGHRYIYLSSLGNFAYAAALIDLGRPPVAGLVRPAAELASAHADIKTLGGPDA